MTLERLSTGKFVVFGEVDKVVPKLYKISYDKWVASGKPDRIRLP